MLLICLFSVVFQNFECLANKTHQDSCRFSDFSLGPKGAMHFNDVLLQHAERLGAIMHKPKRKGHGKGNAEFSHQQRQDADAETIKQNNERL